MTDGKTKRETILYDPIARFVLARGYPGKAVRFPRSSALRDLRGFLIPEGGGTEGHRFPASSTPASPHMVLPPGKRVPQKDAVRRNQRTLSRTASMLRPLSKARETASPAASPI